MESTKKQHPLTHMDSPARFRDQDYLLVHDFLKDPLLLTSYQYVVRLALTGKLMSDSQSKGSLSLYGDTFMDTLMDVAEPTVSAATGLDLAPTYSFVRIYMDGDSLPPHTDRDACEVTVSVCLGSEPEATDAADAWPIFIRPPGSDTSIEVACRPGDALIFRGQKLLHWREPFVGEHQALVFLHYVDRNGPFAGLENDGRAILGTPSASRN